MQPTPEMLEEIDALRKEHAAAEAEQNHEQQEEYERIQLIESQCSRARIVGQKVAKNFDTGSMYLGGDALSRHYHSDWLTIGEVADREGVVMQAQLQHSNRVVRDHGIEMGEVYAQTIVRFRLFDETTELSTGECIIGTFLGDRVTRPGVNPGVILPEDPEWTDLDEILSAFEAPAKA